MWSCGGSLPKKRSRMYRSPGHRKARMTGDEKGTLLCGGSFGPHLSEVNGLPLKDLVQATDRR